MIASWGSTSARRVGVLLVAVLASTLAVSATRRGGSRYVDTLLDAASDAPFPANATPTQNPIPTPHRVGTPPSPSSPVPQKRALTPDELATLRRLDPDTFARLPPEAGSWDPSRRNPCWRDAATGTPRCLPLYHVVGAWQSGGQDFNAKLATHPDVRFAPQTHFWNEDRPIDEYLARYDAFAREAMSDAAAADADESASESSAVVVGDPSPGVFANTWTESQRLHRTFKDVVATCWRACQSLPDKPPPGSPPGTPTERRACVDGVDGDDDSVGCGEKAARADPPRESPGGHALSVPHLVRAAYGDRADAVRVVAVFREPRARTRAAFWHYEHYRKFFGDDEAGFSAFVDAFADAFESCEAEHGREGCAHRFEAYHPKYEAVFYHCDQLIKSMYGTFARGWLEMFGREGFLALRSEDVFSQDQTVRVEQLRRAIRHLGLRELSDEKLREMDASPGMEEDARLATRDGGESDAAGGAGGRAGGGSVADPRAMARLAQIFEPEKRALAEMFQDEAFLWRDHE